uniref:Uncharacterized protein n=1 Tax=Anopheles farauti TaxID=69004 RepID=A0A182QFC6_9DIPT
MYRLLIPSTRHTVSSLIRIHGCCSTAVALSRFGASFTSSPRIRSFASSLTSCHSLSGKQYRPSWIDSNSSSWQVRQFSPRFHPQSCSQLPENGGYPHSRMYAITPSDHRSHRLS